VERLVWKGWCGKAGVERLVWKDGNKKGKLSFPLSKQAINRFLLLLSFLLLSFFIIFLIIISFYFYYTARAIYYFIARTLASQLLETMH
jgi:hypothetical protein